MDKMSEEEERYLIKIVCEDLIYLKKEWDQEISDESLRRSSNVLRNLLVEDQFGKAWRIVGFEKQPRIKAPDLELCIEGLDLSKITLAQAGGAFYHGMQIMAFAFGKYILTPEQRKKRAQKTPESLEREFYLTEYLDSPCIIIKGTKINRRQLIKYVANKLGGTHVDFRRNPSIDADKKYIVLDSTPNNLEIGEKKAVYLELLAIGQSIAKTSDIEKFISMVDKLESNLYS